MNSKSLKIAVLLIICWCAIPARGQVWKPLGQGFAQIPVAVSGNTEHIYFAFADSVSAQGGNKIFAVARWNGIFWQNLSTFIAGPKSYITTLAWYNDKLYTGGYFDTVYWATGETGLLVLDGKKWLNAARRRNDDKTPIRINDLQVFDGSLYAAGGFSRIDTTRANGLAKYNGSKWEAVNEFQENTFAGQATDMELYNDTLFVCGNYKRVQANKAVPLFKIKGNSTVADSSSPFHTITRLQAGTGEMMAFGLNSLAENTIYAYKNGGWANRSKGFPNIKNAKIADAEFYNNEFWACGYIDLGNSKTNSIIKWADTSWVTLEAINLPGVRFIKSYRNRLFVTGAFINFRNVVLNHVTEFDENLAIITGRVYHDANNNCIRDNNEKPLPGQVVRLFSGLVVAYTDREGIFYFAVPKSGTYPITLLPKKYWSLSSCNPSQYVFSPSGTNAIFDTADFALRLDATVEDVSVKILPNAGYKVRRGYTELYSLSFKNNGGKTVPTGTIKLKIHDSLKNFTALPPAASINNGIATWNFANLEPGQEKTILFTGKVNGGTISQISLQAEAVSTNDAFSQDNYDTLQQTVEDNDALNGKYIFPEPAQGDTVTVFSQAGQHEVQYLVRFENNTPDTVNTVIVIDTIDLNLSIEYIQELGASHAYTTQVVNLPPQLGKGVLIWTFNNINLPPNPGNNNDYTGNRGHIRFKLLVSDKTPLGTLVTNKAHVVFDFATYIATNNVYCMLDRLDDIQTPQQQNGISLYPNPALNTLNVSVDFADNFTLTISDIQGRTCLLAQTVAGNAHSLDVSALPQGIYIVRIAAGQTTAYSRFIKE